MNGYSKISSSSSTGAAHKSRSIDFSDFFSFPQTPKPTSSRNSTTGVAKPEVNLQEVKRSKVAQQNCSVERESDEISGNGNINNGERFGVILGRSSSVSNSSSSASTGIQATMKLKRAFSMRRSSSVSERYCRIHDQYMANIGDDDIDNIDGGEDHVIGGGTTRSVMKKKKKKKKKKNRGGAGGGKILKACKRLLGF